VALTTGELARQLGVELQGDENLLLERVAPLDKSSAGALSFVSQSKYRKLLQHTGASAVIIRPQLLADCPVTALLAQNPYATYAHAAQLLYPAVRSNGEIHPAAVIGHHCHIDSSVSIGAHAVIGNNVTLAAGVIVGPGCFVGDDCSIGIESRLSPRSTLLQGVRMGERCLIHSGAVIGADGFGFANDAGVWIKIPQVGGVVIGDDVEVGANTTIDRGAIEDTVIGNGVKLDNQIQIAHNVRIGDHTAIAGCTGISGSTTIGSYCAIGGGVGIAGHLQIADRVTLTGTTFVTQSITESGSYSSGVPFEETGSWRRNYVRFRQLDQMAKQLQKLTGEEDETGQENKNSQNEGEA
jgi:UDP-3-O-[3-hydroxymyristoyl] glucosamine N-acyltransferase